MFQGRNMSEPCTNDNFHTSELRAGCKYLIWSLYASFPFFQITKAELEAKNQELEAKNQELEARLDAVEAWITDNAQLIADNAQLIATNAQHTTDNAQLIAQIQCAAGPPGPPGPQGDPGADGTSGIDGECTTQNMFHWA